MIISSTTSIYGSEIVEHLGVVVAHKAVGTGWIVSMLSGISDFLGAGSGAYEKKLSEISNAITVRISKNARRMGANAIVGLRIDYEELGAGGKGLLMVSAIGTAVVLRRVSQIAPRTAGLRSFSPRDVAAVSANAGAREDVVSGRFMVTDAAPWEELSLAPSVSCVPHLLKRFGQPVGVGPERSQAEARFSNYLALLDPGDVAQELFGFVSDESNSMAGGDCAVRLIVSGHYLNTEQMKILLGHEVYWVRHRALSIAAAHLPTYDEEAPESLLELAEQILSAFPAAAEEERPGLLGRTKAIVRCPRCQNEYKATHPRCPATGCLADRNGVRADEPTPDSVAAVLRGRASAVSSLFNVAQSPVGTD